MDFQLGHASLETHKIEKKSFFEKNIIFSIEKWIMMKVISLQEIVAKIKLS